MLSGRADAMLGGFRNIEGVDLAERGEDPRVVPVDELGIPTYDELVLVASRERLAEDPEAIRLFIAALERGTAAAVADPEAATEAVLDAGDGLDPELTARRDRGDPAAARCPSRERAVRLHGRRASGSSSPASSPTAA